MTEQEESIPEELNIGNQKSVDKFLEEMFGDAYLDTADHSRENILEELREMGKEGFYVANVTGLIGKADMLPKTLIRILAGKICGRGGNIAVNVATLLVQN